jgi:hypothetical protein
MFYYVEKNTEGTIIAKHRCKNEIELADNQTEITEEEFDEIVFPSIEQPQVKSQLEILQETVDMLLINSLGGGLDV